MNLGFTEVKGLCNKHGNGMIVIRGGVMKRVEKKT